MGVTRLLFLGQFYTIQMQFYVLLCTRLYAYSPAASHFYRTEFDIWADLTKNLPDLDSLLLATKS